MARSKKNDPYYELLRETSGEETYRPAHMAESKEEPSGEETYRPAHMAESKGEPSGEETYRPAHMAESKGEASGEETYRPAHMAESKEDAPDESRPAPRRDAEKRRSTPQRRPQKKRRKRRKHKSARIYSVLIMLTLILVISITLAMGIIEVGKDMLGINGTQTLKVFEIPENATTSEIADSLHEQGIIRIPKAFVFFSRLSKADASYIAGKHEVSSAMAYEALIAELTGSAMEENEVVDVMFPEGCTLYEAAQKLEENNVCDASKFLYYFNTGGMGYEFEKHLPTTTSKLKFYRMEGYLFPDTYTFYEEMEPADVCNKIYVNFNSKITEEDYARMDELHIGLDEMITFASMVQAEAANEEEMPKIASVFWNRLNAPDTYPQLQSDPTKKYVERTIKPNIELGDQLIYDAYDTYTCTGLPAGAIGNPGRAAIDAVLHPAETDYYYFYANVDTGVTYFARTLEEHEQNIEKVKQQQAAAEDGE